MSRALPLIVAGQRPPAPPPPPAPVVVFDPAEGAGEQATRDAWLDQFGRDAQVRFVSAETVFPATSQLVLLGDAAVASCDGDPVDAAGFSALTDAVADKLAMMEYLEAATALSEAEAALPCLSETPTTDALGRHHFLRGVVAFYGDGHEAAVDRFEEALLASPFLQWDERFPPPLRPAFDEAVTSALAAGSAFLGVSGRITAEGGLWLDGLPVDRRTRTTTLFEGTHLVQWRPEGAGLMSWIVHAGEGQSVELVHRADAMAQLLTGGAGAALTDYAMARVLAPVEREAGARLFVAQPWDVTLFHEFDNAGQRWWLADIDAIEDWRASGRRMRGAGIGMLAGGLATFIIGGAVGIDGYVYAADTRSLIYGDDLIGLRSDFDALAPSFNEARRQAGVGVGLSVVGGVVAIAGVPLLATGHQRARSGKPPRRD